LPVEVVSAVGTITNATTAAMGLYVTCRLSSDDEPERRVWKMSTRLDTSRGEQLYQAQFELPKRTTTLGEKEKEWSTIYLPFSKFQLVRGARKIPNATSLDQQLLLLDDNKGLYQMGMTMSKFVLADKMTALENFRPGYFELQIQQIGLYYPNDKETVAATTNGNSTTTQAEPQVPQVESLTPQQAMAKRPLILKLVLSLVKLFFFTEASQRRKSAMRILKEERKMSRLQAIQFGLAWRAKQVGWIRSATKLLAILGIDILRQSVKTTVRFGLLKPLQLVQKVIKRIKMGLSGKQTNTQQAPPASSK